jgi:hypothetical protein
MLGELVGALGAGVVAGVVEVGTDVSPSVGACVRCTTTFGALTGGGGEWTVLVGAVVGVVTVGVVVVVVLAGGSLTGVVVVAGGGVCVVVPVGVVLVVVVCVGASGAGVVVVEVSVEVAGSVGVSAASAAPDSGPPRPTTVNPPPASAERIARRVHERASFTPDIFGPCSSCFVPWSRWSRTPALPRRPLDAIHIGREADMSKGFVIEP